MQTQRLDIVEWIGIYGAWHNITTVDIRSTTLPIRTKENIPCQHTLLLGTTRLPSLLLHTFSPCHSMASWKFCKEDCGKLTHSLCHGLQRRPRKFLGATLMEAS